MISRGRDVTGRIQPRYVYQFTFLIHHEPMEHWEVDENTNVDVFQETKENNPRPSKYAKAQVNA
jgi:hypothetical protein